MPTPLRSTSPFSECLSCTPGRPRSCHMSQGGAAGWTPAGEVSRFPWGEGNVLCRHHDFACSITLRFRSEPPLRNPARPTADRRHISRPRGQLLKLSYVRGRAGQWRVNGQARTPGIRSGAPTQRAGYAGSSAPARWVLGLVVT